MEIDKRIAVLIDADNVSEKYVKFIFNEISNHGTPTYKRIYGDWTKPQLSSWKNVLLNYSITPIQQYGYTTGKNATDAALIIDAMDILYSKNVEGFCIVSSDSDFTKLASRLREAGMLVIGMGEKKTPTPFISACEKFKYLEVIATVATDTPSTSQINISEENDKPDSSKTTMANTTELIEAIKAIITEYSDEDGWAFLGDVGNILNRRYPDFDTRNYGYSKLTPFVSSLKVFEIKSQKINNSNSILKYVRINKK
jgi:hypothetical protein